MRLFLDAHVSGRRIGEALRERGHDVRGADEERALDGWDDDDLLALAASEKRIMITFNVKDFPEITRHLSEAGKHHAGCAIIVGIKQNEFGAVLRALDSAFAAKALPKDWLDRAFFVSRAQGGP